MTFAAVGQELQAAVRVVPAADHGLCPAFIGTVLKNEMCSTDEYNYSLKLMHNTL